MIHSLISINRLLESVSLCPKVITLSGTYCTISGPLPFIVQVLFHVPFVASFSATQNNRKITMKSQIQKLVIEVEKVFHFIHVRLFID